MDSEQKVPDRESLIAARQRREDGWQLIRRKYIHDGDDAVNQAISAWTNDNVPALPVMYESAVANADALADERQDKADIAAKRDNLQAMLQRLYERNAKVHKSIVGLETKREELQQEWNTLWATCGIAPRSPRAMLEWLGIFCTFSDAEASQRVRANKLATLTRQIEQFESALRSALGEPDASPARLLEVARQQVKAAQEAAAQRRAYEENLPDQEEAIKRSEEDLSHSRDELVSKESRWKSLLEELGFPQDWDTRTTRRALTVLADARQQWEKETLLEERIGQMESEVTAFKSQVHELCRAISPECADFPPEEAVQDLVVRLEAAKQSARDNEVFTAQLANAERRAKHQESQKKALESALLALRDSAGVDTNEEFVQLGHIALKRQKLEKEIEDARREIRLIAADEDEEDFLQVLRDLDVDTINQSQLDAQEALTASDEAYKTSVENATTARERLAVLDRQSEAIEKASEAEGLRAKLRGLVERWAALVFAQTLLAEAIGRFEQEHQPALLHDVESLFSKMTAGRYTKVHRRLDEEGTLVVEQQDGQNKEPSQLSRGTREQLYLAMRLAYIRRYCNENEPLPLVMDDVLVNFDEERAKSTLAVLSDMSSIVQIVLLTCHQSTERLVLDNVPDATSIQLQI